MNDTQAGHDQGPRPSTGWQPMLRQVAWLVFLLLLLSWWTTSSRQPAVVEIPYSEFKESVRLGKVAEVTLAGDRLRGSYVDRATGDEERPKHRFTSTLPGLEDPELLPLLQEHGVVVRARSRESAWWLRSLLTWLPWLVILGLVFYSMRRMQERMFGGGGPANVFGFGKSRARRFEKGKVGVRFDDVAGVENAKRDLQEIVEFLRSPQSYTALGAKIPRGLLLMGPPGTGKTLLAKAVAGEAEVPFFSISGSEFVEMFVGVGAARVRDLFDGAKKEAPAIIFIDEIDAVGRARGAGVGGGHDEREQTLNQILNEMDGFEPHQSVVVLAATNRPDVLDPALLRPGRFDRKVTLELPRREARLRILEVHAREVPTAADVDLHNVAARTVGFSGADLENLVNEAALLAARAHRTDVDMAMLDEARDKLLLGPVRDSALNDDERRVVAYHEAGHALVALHLPHADPVEKVTIVPRGRALGATEQMPEEDRHNLRQDYLLDRLAVLFGGRAAEKVVYGEVSSGAEADLEEATRLARRMICRWGMSEVLGPVVFRRGEEHVFLGRELAQTADFSDDTARVIDEEIRRLLGEAEERAISLIRGRRDQLERLAGALLEAETLSADAIHELLELGPGSRHLSVARGGGR